MPPRVVFLLCVWVVVMVVIMVAITLLTVQGHGAHALPTPYAGGGGLR